jgi:hypothetical protein
LGLRLVEERRRGKDVEAISEQRCEASQWFGGHHVLLVEERFFGAIE